MTGAFDHAGVTPTHGEHCDGGRGFAQAVVAARRLCPTGSPDTDLDLGTAPPRAGVADLTGRGQPIVNTAARTLADQPVRTRTVAGLQSELVATRRAWNADLGDVLLLISGTVRCVIAGVIAACIAGIGKVIASVRRVMAGVVVDCIAGIIVDCIAGIGVRPARLDRRNGCQILSRRPDVEHPLRS